MAVGTSPYRAQITQTVGTVAYRHREPRLALLQLTNTVYPGYSGGAVLNARGELIGLVQGEVGTPGGDVAVESRGGNSFVLPAEIVQPIYRSLREDGRVPHGYLGVSTRAASVESDTQEGLQVPIGALVESVQPGGPAARLGLRHGDLIVGFEGERVEYPEQLAQWVAATPPGTSVALVWVRGETPRNGRVTLLESSEPMPEWSTIASASDGAGDPSARIADLQRQIQKLNRELERLKGAGTSSH
jgi:serine protease Do